MFRHKIIKSFFYLLFPLAIQFSFSQTIEIPTLEAGKTIEREISGGQKHSFQINLEKGQYANILLQQNGIDVLIRAFGADGKLFAEFDREFRTNGAETAEMVASENGLFKLEVEAKVKNAPAASYKITFAELRSASDNDFSLQEARSLMTESRRLERAGKYLDALPLLERALGIREKILGTENVETAIVINRLGILQFSLGDLEKSEIFLKRANEIYEKLTAPNELDVADTLGNLAVIRKIKGDFIESEKLQLRVLEIRERVLGTNHNLVASAFNNLGVLYRKRGENTKAEQMYRRSLEIRERLFGAESIEVASVLVNISSLSFYKGDYENALVLDRRILEIREKILNPEHPEVAVALENLALIYIELRDFEKAEPLLKRSLKIHEKSAGQDSAKLVNPLLNLVKLYGEKGEYEKAEPLLKRALQISEKKDSLPDYSISLKTFGDFYTLKGDYAQAEPLYQKALEIKENFFGENHFEVGFTCDALARLYFLKGDAAQAIKMQECANRIHEKNIALNLVVGTEHQKLSFMRLMSENLNQTIALHVNLAKENHFARDDAATAILQRKGRVLDAMTDNLSALRSRFDANDKSLIDRLNDANAQLAELTLNQPETKTLTEYQNQISTVRERKEKVENEISRRSEGFYEQAKTLNLADIKKVIPADAALIEFVVYQPIDAKKQGKEIFGEPHYAVYVIRNQGEIGWAELGAAKDVDAAIDQFRVALRDVRRQDVKKLARALDEKIMLPLRASFGDAKHLLISPDGNLSLIPFEALVDEKNQYAVENYSFTYLTSGRDLLRMNTKRENKNNPLVIANPLFGASETVAQVSSGNKRRSITATRNLTDTFFAPLGGTMQEARAIQLIFPNADFLNGIGATETALKRTNAPQILHLATHGFFLEDKKIGNPLLRSGLAFAGANSRKGEKDDGILTALEASGLNLWGTKLVVLSACDTGLGEVRNGEGVYGLRRAFILAGTESLVMSLWSISDYVTRELMTNYYKNLKNGLGRGASLRQVQLEMLKKPNRQHPFYWASFIQSGDWTGLESKKEKAKSKKENNGSPRIVFFAVFCCAKKI
ncbi:CHAT domain-containing protein [soil metagenome]